MKVGLTVSHTWPEKDAKGAAIFISLSTVSPTSPFRFVKLRSVYVSWYRTLGPEMRRCCPKLLLIAFKSLPQSVLFSDTTLLMTVQLN